MTRILIVEDNEMNQDMLSRRLIRRGYEILIAEDGRKGVEMAMSERPDLILMDLSLPEMDGCEATRAIRAEQSVSSTPIIALTAHAMTSDREKALQAGCDEFETKPVEITRLLEKIERFVGAAKVAQV